MRPPEIPPARARALRAAGIWRDERVLDRVAAAMRRTPDKPALTAYRAGQPAPRRFTYAQLWNAALRLAGALRQRGIGQGDVVSVQLPNWWEFAVTALACARLGAVVNPLMPIFREHELRYMLKFAETRLLIVPKFFRGCDHAEMIAGLRPELPDLAHVITVDGEGPDAFDALLASDAPPEFPSPARPDDAAVLVFTSGTTGMPKGAIHSDNTLLACITGLAERFALSARDSVLACSPAGHMTGYAAGIMLGFALGATVVLQDVWDGKTGVAIMAAEAISFTAGSTPFLTDICAAVAGGMQPPPALRAFLCGGAPIPPVLIERALRELNVSVCSLWGSTECLSGTLTEPARAHEKSATSDGRPILGIELEIQDEAGALLPAGQTGRLMVRGGGVFLGYYKRPLSEAFTADGWFDTGDLAYADAEGYIRINGRSKDILIRGGENIPVFEIEDLLYRHPAIATAAIVGYPDARLGERACAFVTLRPGAEFSFAALRLYMAEAKVAKQYWPERLEILETLPTTASGKIKKFELRALLLDMLREAQAE